MYKVMYNSNAPYVSCRAISLSPYCRLKRIPISPTSVFISLRDYPINVNILWCEANQTGFGTIKEFVIMDSSFKRVITLLSTVVVTETKRWR